MANSPCALCVVPRIRRDGGRLHDQPVSAADGGRDEGDADMNAGTLTELDTRFLKDLRRRSDRLAKLVARMKDLQSAVRERESSGRSSSLLRFEEKSIADEILEIRRPRTQGYSRWSITGAPPCLDTIKEKSEDAVMPSWYKDRAWPDSETALFDREPSFAFDWTTLSRRREKRHKTWWPILHNKRTIYDI